MARQSIILGGYVNEVGTRQAAFFSGTFLNETTGAVDATATGVTIELALSLIGGTAIGDGTASAETLTIALSLVSGIASAIGATPVTGEEIAGTFDMTTALTGTMGE